MVTMTDCEMLAYAARAIRLRLDTSPFNGGGKGNTGFDIDGNAVLDWHNGKTWNPRTRDADAFNLMVKLGMDVSVDRIGMISSAHVPGAGQSYAVDHSEGGEKAATRLAILKAGAEYGHALALAGPAA